jgi:hypothetical protein
MGLDIARIGSNNRTLYLLGIVIAVLKQVKSYEFTLKAGLFRDRGRSVF